MKTRLVVVDISSFIFRAFYAIRMLNAPDGTPVNAVHGVLNMMLKLIETQRPTHIIVARDTAGPTFRHVLYDKYKANRSEPPDDLKPQFSLVKKLIDLMNITSVGLSDVEADDVIGSVCVQWKSHFDEIIIASTDKDIMQFVGENIVMIDTMKDKIYDRSAVKEKMGVWPEQIHDYLAIVGDSSDNIPGVKGIGAKGAADLLEQFATLEDCLKDVENLPSKKYINAFRDYRDDAILSKKLTKIKTDVVLGRGPEDTRCDISSSDELMDFLRSLGFKSILQKVMQISCAPAGQRGPSEPHTKELLPKMTDLEFEQFIQSTKLITLAPLFSKTHPANVESRMIGVWNHLEQKYYIEMSEQKFVEKMQLRLMDTQLEIVCDDYKLLLLLFKKFGFSVDWRGFDIQAAHYLLGPDDSHKPIKLIEKYLSEQIKLPKEDDLLSLTDESMQELGYFARGLFELSKIFKDDLSKKEILHVYNKIDCPVIPVLASLEFEGVLIDKECLKRQEGELEKELEDIQKTIFSSSGEEINLKSPKQVAVLLFEKLKMPIIKKTKTGPSTDSEVLEELAAGDYGPIPELMLQFRETEKLLSTYVKALPELVDPKTNRIHTSYGITTAATGRLSSVNPNLQNIPIRTERGRRVRAAFVAKPDHLFLAADYSQIELRILAHLSQDPTMVTSFLEGRDIHTQTASEVLGISLAEVKREDRSMAKAVNFGLMYGQSSFGLSRTLRISRNQARDYIEKYFTRFSRVKSFLDGLKEDAEKSGYSITMFGRKRFLPDIQSSNRTIKSQAERVAINSPIQGAAADLIKMAMRTIWNELEEHGYRSKMILQVHDELIFEVHESEQTKLSAMVKKHMEGVTKMTVPLVVDIATGKNWYELK